MYPYLSVARIYRGLTTAELAEKINVPEKKLIAWEKGESKPSIAALVDLTNTLQVPADFLIGRINLDDPVRE